MFDYKNRRKHEEQKHHAKLLAEMIHRNECLVDSFIVDFFVDNHWEKLPNSWREALDSFDFSDIVFLLSPTHIPSHKPIVFPLSLLSFRAASFALQVPRAFDPQLEIFLSQFKIKLCDTKPCDTKSFDTKSFDTKLCDTELCDTELCDTKLCDTKLCDTNETVKNANKMSKFLINETWNADKSIFNRKMKLKKRHEILRLSQVTHSLINLVPNCKTVVDCGSGQGHLSRVLSLIYGYNVICIEANDKNIKGAGRLDTKLLESICKMNKNNNNLQVNRPPNHVHCKLSQSSSFNDTLCINNDYILMGLHACGSLSSIILKNYVQNSDAKGLVLVSCCYMKLDDESFPMSEFIKSLLKNPISYEAKEVACHAIEKYVNKLLNTNNPKLLQVHCYRATLETLLVKYHHVKHLGLNGVKMNEDVDFREFCKKALEKHNILIPEHEFSSDHVKNCLAQYKRVIIFYSLRLLAAPLIESLILLDHILYLTENGFNSSLFPLFDPIVSPRNNVLISIKENVLNSVKENSMNT